MSDEKDGGVVWPIVLVAVVGFFGGCTLGLRMGEISTRDKANECVELFRSARNASDSLRPVLAYQECKDYVVAPQ